MPATINSHNFSNSQIAQLVSATDPRDVTLTFWDKFKDIFRTNTKQAEVQRLVTQIHGAHTDTSDNILTKLESFNRLMGLAKESERIQFSVSIDEPKFSAGGTIASSEVSFNVGGQSIGKSPINDTSTLRTYRNVIAYQAISTISSHIAHGTFAADNAMSLCFRDPDEASYEKRNDAALIFRSYLLSVPFKDILAEPAALEAAVCAMQALDMHWDDSALNLAGVELDRLVECGAKLNGASISTLVEQGVSLKGVTPTRLAELGVVMQDASLAKMLEAGMSLSGLKLNQLAELGIDMKDASLGKMLRAGLTGFETSTLKTLDTMGLRLENTPLFDLKRAGFSFRMIKLSDLINKKFIFNDNPTKTSSGGKPIHINDLIKAGISCADVKFAAIRADGISMDFTELPALIRKGVDVSDVSLDDLRRLKVSYQNMSDVDLARAGVRDTDDNNVPAKR